MGRYGNIDGIVTLTNNPNATDNAKGTIGKRNRFWGDAVKMDEVCTTVITEDYLANAIKEMCCEKPSQATYIVTPDIAKALSQLK